MVVENSLKRNLDLWSWYERDTVDEREVLLQSAHGFLDVFPVWMFRINRVSKPTSLRGVLDD